MLVSSWLSYELLRNVCYYKDYINLKCKFF